MHEPDTAGGCQTQVQRSSSHLYPCAQTQQPWWGVCRYVALGSMEIRYENGSQFPGRVAGRSAACIFPLHSWEQDPVQTLQAARTALQRQLMAAQPHWLTGREITV